MKFKALIGLALISFPVHGQLPGFGSLIHEPDNDVHVTIVLPFNSNDNPNNNFIDFYSGVLLAAKDLGSQDIRLSINVFDTKDSSKPLTRNELENSDIIIGPVSVQDICKVLELLPDDKFIISPLEQKAESMVTDSRVIQIPTPQDIQSRDLVRWLAEDMQINDRAVLVCDPSSTGSPLYNIFSEELDRMGVSAHRLIYNAANDDSNQPRFEAASASDGTTRFLIASENESFVNDIVRNVNLLNFKKFNVELYGLSRVRSYESIEVEYLHNCKLNTTNRYFVDYRAENVKSFVKKYRMMFSGEPNSFAFQGYDIMSYFINLRISNGPEWINFINVPSKGMQLNFLFSSYEQGGAVNTAVRRVSYHPDYSVGVR